MKIPTLRIRKKKLRASTARKSLGITPELEYEEMSEPNMKLSRALLIVLVLHVVAVTGIIAFNTIKTRQSSFRKPAPASNPVASSQTGQSSATKPVAALVRSETSSLPVRRADAKAAHPVAKAVAKDEHKADPARPHPDSVAADPGKTYVVAKGDNPVTIAKKFKVSYDDLLALNKIEDPHKLQIGQKLLIPKAAKAKKADE